MEKSGPADDLLKSMEEAEPLTATLTMDRLTIRLRDEGKDGLDMDSLRSAYLRLLRRRGYFVDTPEALLRSLAEIAAVGPGFDLYDLSRSLARYDTLRTDCLHQSSSRTLPELRKFHARCVCGNHRKET
jgi:hypothetical protein